MDGWMDRWMDDLQFYVSFNSISVISGQRTDDNEGCVQWNPVYSLEDFDWSGARTRDR